MAHNGRALHSGLQPCTEGGPPSWLFSNRARKTESRVMGFVVPGPGVQVVLFVASVTNLGHIVKKAIPSAMAKMLSMALFRVD